MKLRDLRPYATQKLIKALEKKGFRVVFQDNFLYLLNTEVIFRLYGISVESCLYFDIYDIQTEKRSTAGALIGPSELGTIPREIYQSTLETVRRAKHDSAMTRDIEFEASLLTYLDIIQNHIGTEHLHTRFPVFFDDCPPHVKLKFQAVMSSLHGNSNSVVTPSTANQITETGSTTGLSQAQQNFVNEIGTQSRLLPKGAFDIDKKRMLTKINISLQRWNGEHGTVANLSDFQVVFLKLLFNKKIRSLKTVAKALFETHVEGQNPRRTNKRILTDIDKIIFPTQSNTRWEITLNNRTMMGPVVVLTMNGWTVEEATLVD